MASSLLTRPVETDVEADAVSTSTSSTAEEALAVDTVKAEHEYTEEYFRKLLCQADKGAIGIQAVFGILQDIHLVGSQFNFLGTGFYLSFSRFRTGRFLGTVMSLRGVVVLVTAFAKNSTDSIILTSTFLLITGSWYRSREHTLRSAIWASSNGGMSIILGLIVYKIADDAELNPISYFLGSLTIMLGIMCFFILGTPCEDSWLSDDQRRAVVARIVDNPTGTDSEKRTHFKMDQALATFKDPQIYLLLFITILNALPGAANSIFANLIFEGFGFTPLQVLLLGDIPYYAVSVAWFLLCGWISYVRPNTRFYLMMASVLPAFIGLLGDSLLPPTTRLWVKWGLFLKQAPGGLPGLLIWTFVPSNGAGAAVGGQIFRPDDAPRYLHGLLASGILYGALFISLIFWHSYCNEQLGKLNAVVDMTDRENIHFKYQY
ncbi:major facilitator superfamily domain-containing protein [Xylariaceae sp. FL0255]|nr:major facilitator superfamily domain-containing protein [Xylariaceae sp. FL0255]